MCGRYILRMQDKYLREWNLHGPPAWVTASYNIAPTQQVPIMRVENGSPAAAMVRWGLVPAFAHGKPGKFSTINARIETVETAEERTIGEHRQHRGPSMSPAGSIFPKNSAFRGGVVDESLNRGRPVGVQANLESRPTRPLPRQFDAPSQYGQSGKQDRGASQLPMEGRPQSGRDDGQHVSAGKDEGPGGDDE